jgi:hypothetical protein
VKSAVKHALANQEYCHQLEQAHYGQSKHVVLTKAGMKVQPLYAKPSEQDRKGKNDYTNRIEKSSSLR